MIAVFRLHLLPSGKGQKLLLVYVKLQSDKLRNKKDFSLHVFSGFAVLVAGHENESFKL